jgi:hypothetical protein
MTNSQLAIILANIWMAQCNEDKKFVFAIALFYLIVYIILGILGK